MTRLAALLLFCSVFGLGGYLLSVRIQPVVDLIEYVPAEAVALVEGENLAQTWALWRHSLVGEKLHQTDFPALLVKLGLEQPLADSLTTLLAQMERCGQLAALGQVFAHQAVAALVAPDSSAEHLLTDPLERLVVIVNVGNGGVPQQWAEALFGVARSRSVQQYQNATLITLRFDGERALTYCLQRGVLIAALREEVVQRCVSQSLQRMVQARTGLQLNPQYQRLRALAGASPDFFLYADTAALSAFQPLLQGWRQDQEGLLPLHLAIFHSAQASRLGIAGLADKAQLAAFTRRHQLAEPVDDPSVPHVSSDTDFSLWTNWFQSKKLWNLAQMKSPPEIVGLMSLFAQYLTTATGQTMDSFFDVFGSEFGVFINQQRAPHQSTSSMACVSVALRDPVQTANALKALTAGLQAVTVVADGTEIVSVVMAGGLLQPAYALVRNQLVLADSVELIEQLLRRSGEQATAGKGRGDRNVRERWGNFFLFVRTGSLAERLLPVLTVLAKENRDKNAMITPRARLLLQEMVLPLLTGLRGVETSRLRGYVYEDEMLLELEYAPPQTALPLLSR